MQRQEAGIRPMSGNHGSLGLRIGSLFSGIGGLELGLEWSGVGQTVYQVEQDAFCRSQLARHWPSVPQWTDIQELDASVLPPADVVVGGFPCQSLSVAAVGGKRLGLQGADSGLWSHMARIIATQKPTWVVVENVAHGQGKWLPTVRGDLGRLGYATLPIPLEARVLGAPHCRPRLFVLAHADSFALRVDEQRLSGRRAASICDRRETVALEHGEPRREEAQPCFSVVDDGIPRGMGGVYWRSVGNAVVPQVAEVIGWMIRELVDAGAVARR